MEWNISAELGFWVNKMFETLPLAIDKVEFSSKDIIAYTIDGQPINWGEILARLDFWKSQLGNLSQIKVAVYHSDAVEFLCILLILWSLKKIPVVPANTLEKTLRAVKKETDYCIGEFPEVTSSQNIDSEQEVLSSDKESSTHALIIFTSGSSGEPKAVYKTFKQLNSELKILENQWGNLLTDTLTLGTVSHHHMFGIQFRLLWPFVSKRPFVSKDIIYFEQLLKLSKYRICLISSPAHLEHIPKTMEWSELQKSMKVVFSAGAPLSKNASLEVNKNMGVLVTEIYGSTETGAVSHRDQTKDPLWNPLKGISVKKIDNKLAIKSPAAIDKGWYVSEDLCEIYSQGHFSLKGRADNIIKVGGKRVSKAAIESSLKEHPLVEKAFVVFLEKRKNRVGAVIQLTRTGSVELIDKGKMAFQKSLLSCLKGNIENVAWPRYWRFVPKMPVNQQGKIKSTELEELFDKENNVNLPDILSQKLDKKTNECILELEIPQNLVFLEGHFPGRPILPGFVQIGWVIHYGQELFGKLGTFIRLEGLKFQHVIQPTEKIILQLKWEEEKNRLLFSYKNRNYFNSKGRVVFEKEG